MKYDKDSTQTTWILLTNATEAQFYQVDGDGAYLFKILEHPASRLKSKDLTTDKPGSYKTSHAARGNFIPTDDPHEDEHDHFSREISELLEHHRQKNDYQVLILCAEPHFHGLLNKHITNQVRLLIKKTIQKDYIPLPKAKISSVIKEIIQKNI